MEKMEFDDFCKVNIQFTNAAEMQKTILAYGYETMMLVASEWIAGVCSEIASTV